MNSSSIERWAGLALISAGVLELVVNSVLTPLLPRGVPFAQTVVSPVFAWRQSIASACAALLLFGTVGLYSRQSQKAGKLGAMAFALAFCGSALLLGIEGPGASVHIRKDITNPVVRVRLCFKRRAVPVRTRKVTAFAKRG